MQVQDVLIVSQFTSVGSNNRFGYLAEILSPHVRRVELLTSSFSHTTKRQQETIPGRNFDVTYVDEPGYKRNISLQRIRSHRALARNVKTYLEKRTPPDVIYCTVPSLDVAQVVGEYAGAMGVPLILDIQDLWPEAFELVIRPASIGRILLTPLRSQANAVYRRANHIVAVSDTYASRALVPGGSGNESLTVYLGTDFAAFDGIAPAIDLRRHSNEVLLAYIGTLGISYDLETVINAIKRAQKSTSVPLRLIVMGDGPHEESFRDLAKKSRIASDFLGRLDYEEMVANLRACDIAVNPIVKGAAQSIINKVGDYAAAGLPVLNTQESTEYRTLINEYDAGINVACEDSEELAGAIVSLAEQPSIRRSLGRGNRRLGEERFDRGQTYPEIVKLILLQSSH